MADLAGRFGDGINVPGGGHATGLVRIAREAHERAGKTGDDFVVTVSSNGSRRDIDRLEELGVHRAVVLVRPPYMHDIERLARER
jgi:alkanesulfonate monooxygenase SsuD/methylene tetrahydromethanopterin reductase-like flavin-dependent oxidoreductase (luciferase family)